MLREGHYDGAAAALHAIALGNPGGPEAEDASFLEAVALARAGHLDAAAIVAEHHLADFPRSFHRKEATILVARAAPRRGECDRTREVLAPWTIDSPDAETRAALHSCGDVGPSTRAHP